MRDEAAELQTHVGSWRALVAWFFVIGVSAGVWSRMRWRRPPSLRVVLGENLCETFRVKDTIGPAIEISVGTLLELRKDGVV